jgi:hypothetical protein
MASVSRRAFSHSDHSAVSSHSPDQIEVSFFRDQSISNVLCRQAFPTLAADRPPRKLFSFMIFEVTQTTGSGMKQYSSVFAQGFPAHSCNHMHSRPRFSEDMIRTPSPSWSSLATWESFLTGPSLCTFAITKSWVPSFSGVISPSQLEALHSRNCSSKIRDFVLYIATQSIFTD